MAPRRRDRFGDPLPAAMRFRIGSERFADSSSPIVISPDGTRIACGSTEGWVTVWDAASGAQLRRLRSPKRPRTQTRVEHLAFAPDAATLATTSSGRMTLWDLETGKALWEQRLGMDFTQPVAFSPDGTRLAAGGNLAPVLLLDAATGAIRRTLADAARHLTFARDGQAVYGGGRGDVVEIPVDGDPDAIRTCELPDVPECTWVSNEVVVHARGDGLTVLAGHLAAGLYELDVASWTVVSHRAWPEGSTREPWASGVALGDELVAVARAGEVFVMPRGAPWQLVAGPETSSCAVTPDGATLVTDHGFVRVRDARTGADRLPIPRVAGDVDLATWHGAHGLVVPYHGRLALHDLATAEVLHDGSVPPGRPLIVDGRAARLMLRDLGEHDRVVTFDGAPIVETDEPRVRCFAPDGTWLGKVGLGYQKGDSLHLQYADGTAREISRGGSTVYATVFSGDGRRVAAGFYDRNGKVWSVATGEVVAEIPIAYIWTIAWSPDDERLLCGIYGGEVRIWNLVTARWDAVIKAHRTMVKTVAWSPDGQLIASAARSGIRLWDATGAPRGKLAGAAEQVLFTPDGKGLIVSRGQIVEVWEVAKLV